MIDTGRWRWPIVMAISLLSAAALFLSGTVHLKYEGKAFLSFSGERSQIDDELKIFRSSPSLKVSIEKVLAQPLQIALHAESGTAPGVMSSLQSAAQACIEESLAQHKKNLQDLHDGFQKQASAWDLRFTHFTEDRKSLIAGPRRNTPRAQIVAKIEELKKRRHLLIEHYPNHTDIPVLAQQIKDLVSQLDKPSRPTAARITELDRQINETHLRRDYFLGRLKEIEKEQLALQASWKIILPIQKPRWPEQVVRWPMGVGAFLGTFILSGLIFRPKRERKSDFGTPEPPIEADLETSKEPVALEVVSPELPSDLLTLKAAELYHKWVSITQLLYTPAAEAPQGLLEQVGPLLQESSDFLPEGHDVLARYLAHVATSGDLASHVARTVLMTLTGAQEAGVSPEHRLAITLAALFHDLAVVPRPETAQEEVGSEVGRLSAGVVARIPGITPALLSMIEDILIGMDEFKLETWQNGAQGMTLEPLSKVLREIDRFEKVMQKQKARLDRRLANQ